MKLKEVIALLPKSALIHITEIAYFKGGEYFSFCTRFNGTIEKFRTQIDENNDMHDKDVILLDPKTLYHDDEYRIGPDTGLAIDIRTGMEITKEDYEKRIQSESETCSA